MPPPTPISPTTIPPRFIIHGGCGAITRANLPPDRYLIFSASLLEINRATASRLAAGASALEAATEAVAAMEDNEWFNCGRGAVFTREGGVELEASVMTTRDHDKRACAVALLTHTKNPIRLAREMLVRGNHDLRGPANSGGSSDPSGGAGGAQGHCVLSGATAEKLAREWGLEMREERYFWTRRRWEQHRRGLGKKGEELGSLNVPGGEVYDEKDSAGYWRDEEGWDGMEWLPQGTVGCVVMDREGGMCVATSTGGLTNKLSGRIGDTPTIGSGFFAEEWWEGRSLEAASGSGEMGQLLTRCLPDGIMDVLKDCFPTLSGYGEVEEQFRHEKKATSGGLRAVAMSGTGNGDSFLRTAATRTAAAIARFSPGQTLASAVQHVAGPGGELQRSAGDRWNTTGEGEGGIIGIELRCGVGEVVANFNCGGMFRSWINGEGQERVMVFKEEY